MNDLQTALPPVRGRLRMQVPLAPRTWLRVGGPAEAILQPADVDDLSAFLKAKPRGLPVIPIGVASNLLVRDGGINSGFMLAQVTAAALVAENRALAAPRSVDSLPTSANQEDHVSMATGAGWRLGEMADNLQGTLAIEWLCAAQAIELHRPLRSSGALEAAHALLREHVAFWGEDRVMAPDIAMARALLRQGSLLKLAPL